MEYWEYEAGQTVLMSVMSFRLGRAKVCNKLQKPIAFDNKDWSFLFYAENPPKQNKRIELSPISLKYFHDEQNLSSTNLNTIILLVVIQFKFFAIIMLSCNISELWWRKFTNLVLWAIVGTTQFNGNVSNIRF